MKRLEKNFISPRSLVHNNEQKYSRMSDEQVIEETNSRFQADRFNATQEAKRRNLIIN